MRHKPVLTFSHALRIGVASQKAAEQQKDANWFHSKPFCFFSLFNGWWETRVCNSFHILAVGKVDGKPLSVHCVLHIPIPQRFRVVEAEASDSYVRPIPVPILHEGPPTENLLRLRKAEMVGGNRVRTAPQLHVVEAW